ncbi:MAG: terpene cyclase/mutase family protein [Thermoguttaceae bacterium]|nr:terpene cyclase/mutase family protein [Thermoguttaceae bacterium]
MKPTSSNRKQINRPISETTVSSANAAPASDGVQTQTSANAASYEEILSEKRSHWLFRIQLCLILSLLAHIGLLAYIHDKYVKLDINLSENHQPADEEKALSDPEPVREPKVISGYDESRLDSPQIQDSFEQLTPTSPAEEQEFNDEKTLPAVDEFNSSFDHEFQTPDSPELSDIPNVTPIAVNEIEAPSEDVQPDVSRTFNTQFNPSNIHKSVPLPEHDQLISTVEHDAPQSDLGSMGEQSVAADSSKVVLDVGNTESIRPTIDESSIPDIRRIDAMPDLNIDSPEQSVSSIPELIQPVTTLRPSSVNHVKENAILAKASSAAPKAQTLTPVSQGPRGIPRASYDSPTAYNELTSKDISKSIVLDSPKRPTSVSIPRNFNAGLGGLNGNEFRSLETPPESTVSIGAPSIVSIKRNDVVPSDAYKKRAPSIRPQMITSFGGDAEINQTIENGLKFLSKTQWPDGRWRFHQQPASLKVSQELQQNGTKKCDTAATALALLSMLGAGYTHKDGLYKEEIQKGLNFLVQHQQTVPIVGKNGVKGAIGAIYDADDVIDSNEANNEFYNYRSYAHAMAATALCEAYGLTHDPTLLPAAQAAARYIIATQNPRLGGWRYETIGMEGQPHIESDTSSSGWQIMALRSAMAAEVLEPDEVIPALNNAQRWLNRAQNPENKRFIYNPDIGMDSKYADWKKTTPAMTAEGLFMQWCINPDLVDSQQTIPYLLQNAPGKNHDLEYDTDVYYWYYGTAVMFAQKGEAWKTWQSAIMPLLQRTQLPADHPCGGSWDTEKPTRDKWSNIGGKHYITTMNLMIMEIYIRHLSIYQ